MPSLKPEEQSSTPMNESYSMDSYLFDIDFRKNRPQHIETYEQGIESSYSALFSKQPAFTFKDLTDVTPKYNILPIFGLIFLALGGAAASVGIYCGILNLFGLWNVSTGLNLLFLMGGLGVVVGSVHAIARIINKTKFFKFQRQEDDCKIIFQKFVTSDTDNIIEDLQKDLYNQLDSKDIKDSNTPVYNYFKESINRLRGDFNKLKYEVDLGVKMSKYSFEPFRVFIAECEKIKKFLTTVDDIKIINRE